MTSTTTWFDPDDGRDDEFADLTVCKKFVTLADHEHALAEKDLVIAGLKEIIQACNKDNLSDAVLRAIVERNQQARELERLRGELEQMTLSDEQQRVGNDAIYRQLINTRDRLRVWIRRKSHLEYAYRGYTDEEIKKLMDDPDWPYLEPIATPAATALQQAKEEK